MPKIVIDEIASGYSLSKINDQFNKIESYINDKVLSRDSDGNANAMSEDLDMNSNQILNLPAPTAPTAPVRLGDIPDLVKQTQGANYVGTTAPESAFEGMRWYDPSVPTTYVYDTTNDVGSWIEEPVQSSLTKHVFITPDMFEGATDDLKFAAAKATAVSLNIRVIRLNRQYNITSFNLDTPLAFICEDDSAEIRFSGTTGFNVTAAHIIRGIKFTSTLTSANGAPLGIFAFESGETSGCTFNNCRLYYRNLTATIKEKAITPDNKFFCDFTNFNPYVTESDVLSARGFSTIVQDRCEFTVTNVNRVIKNGQSVYAFADDYADTSTCPKIIRQHQIKVRGSTSSGKQVFDHFTCQGGVYINDECDVEVTGFGVVYENKTNRSNADVDTTEIISKPHFKNNGSCIKVEGTRGNTASSGIYAQGRKKLIITDDDLENTGTGSITGTYGIIDVKYCDVFKYDGGYIKDKAGNNNQAMLIGGCRSVDLNVGNIIGSYIRFQDSTGSQQGDTHSTVTDVININGGSFSDCTNPLQGFIVFRTLVNTNLSIAVTGVSAKNTTTLASAGGLVCLRDMTAYSVTVNGCSIKQVSNVDERVFTSNATVTKYLQAGNSWQGAALP